MTSSSSDFVQIRGLRYHVRRWGNPDAPMLFLAHGWMDLSATFEKVVQHLVRDFQVLIPDWRGFGLSEWDPNGYWFPDYVGDLDALVDHYAPHQSIHLAGHSMGAQIASLYAGLRPNRVDRLAILDGLFLPDGDASTIARRYRAWLNANRKRPSTPTYPDFNQLAQRVKKRHPKIDDEMSHFIARCWGEQGPDGVVKLASDPRHLLEMPRTYSQAESDAIWSCVTAKTLFIDGGDSPFPNGMEPEEMARRRAQFRDRQQIVIEGAGHMLHFEVPDELGAALLAFFTEVSNQ